MPSGVCQMTGNREQERKVKNDENNNMADTHKKIGESVHFSNRMISSFLTYFSDNIYEIKRLEKGWGYNRKELLGVISLIDMI